MEQPVTSHSKLKKVRKTRNNYKQVQQKKSPSLWVTNDINTIRHGCGEISEQLDIIDCISKYLLMKNIGHPKHISVRLKTKICLWLLDRLCQKLLILNFFLQKSAKMVGDLSENFHVSLGPATSCICLLKSRRFA